MNRLKNIFYCLCLTVLIGCTENDDSSIIIWGSESYVQSIEDIMPESLMRMIGNVQEGMFPPNIEGEYVISPNVLDTSNLSTDCFGTRYFDRYIRFHAQHNRICGFDSYQNGEWIHSDTIFLIGGGNSADVNRFTAYFVSERNDSTAYAKVATIINGKMNANGIEDLQYALYIIEKDDPDELFLPENSLRVFIDKSLPSGLAKRYDWYDSLMEEPLISDKIIPKIEKP